MSERGNENSGHLEIHGFSESHVDRIGKRPPRIVFAMFAREIGLDFTSARTT